MFQGVYTAMITPFNQDESLDEGALRALTDFQIEQGISGLVPMGTTGESPTVTHEENLEAVRIVVDQARGRVPVIAGTGSNSTQEAVNMTVRARDIGATASLQVAPYYNKPSQEGFYRHFTTIADKSDLPVLVYNIPGRTGKNIENDTMLRMAEHPKIVGVKEASGSMPQVMDLIARKPQDFVLLSGDDNLALPIIALGGVGIVSVASNLFPKEMQVFSGKATSGDLRGAQEDHYRLLPFFKALFADTNPIPIKYAMARTGHCREVYRLPLVAPADAVKKLVDDVLRGLGAL
ncbi:MAG: 4-hydroxy-tetrahydrodipicolinate synthase [Spirochaetaceae bacterium]